MKFIENQPCNQFGNYRSNGNIYNGYSMAFEAYNGREKHRNQIKPLHHKRKKQSLHKNNESRQCKHSKIKILQYFS